MTAERTDAPRFWIAGLLLLLILQGCGEMPVPTQLPTAPPQRMLRIAVVEGARIQLDQSIRRCAQRHPEVGWEVVTLSATRAQEALAAGTFDLALVDVLPGLLYEGVLTATQAFSEPIAVVIHPQNQLEQLPTAAVAELLGGRTADWALLGGEAGPVQIYLRAEPAGEVAAMATAMEGRPLASWAVVRASGQSVLQAVAGNRGGIGLLPLSQVTEGVTVMRVGGIAPGETGYPWHMPFYLVWGANRPAETEELVECTH